MVMLYGVHLVSSLGPAWVDIYAARHNKSREWPHDCRHTTFHPGLVDRLGSLGSLQLRTFSSPAGSAGPLSHNTGWKRSDTEVSHPSLGDCDGLETDAFAVGAPHCQYNPVGTPVLPLLPNVTGRNRASPSETFGA